MCGNRRIRQVGEQREMQIRIVICQEPDFEVFGQAANLLFIQQQRGTATRVVQSSGMSLEKSSFGRISRPKQRRGQIVHHLHCALRSTAAATPAWQTESSAGGVIGAGQQQHNRRHDPEGENLNSGK